MPVSIGQVSSTVEIEGEGTRGTSQPEPTPTPAPPSAPEMLRWRLGLAAFARDRARLAPRDQDD
ncbi:hypothetical protein [Falsiroseomonas sp. HW251]|uniref:hypothetical protein n=1 Tax=Falsiroseomonas sp. HW251 TaxID=3390998 RepID=UPI003D31158B